MTSADGLKFAKPPFRNQRQRRFRRLLCQRLYIVCSPQPVCVTHWLSAWNKEYSFAAIVKKKELQGQLQIVGTAN